eukprot:11198254-Lingulodinium_polyedra.AAC.1
MSADERSTARAIVHIFHSRAIDCSRKQKLTPTTHEPLAPSRARFALNGTLARRTPRAPTTNQLFTPSLAQCTL